MPYNSSRDTKKGDINRVIREERVRKILALLVLGLLIIPILYGSFTHSQAAQVEFELSTVNALLMFFSAWLDTPALFMLGGFLVGGALLSCPMQHLTGAFNALFKTSPLDAKESARASAVFHQLAALTVGSGLLGSIVMWMRLLFNIDDPSTIGPLTAMALFPLLYSSLLGSILFYAFASDVEARAWPTTSTPPTPIRRSP